MTVYLNRGRLFCRVSFEMPLYGFRPLTFFFRHFYFLLPDANFISVFFNSLYQRCFWYSFFHFTASFGENRFADWVISVHELLFAQLCLRFSVLFLIHSISDLLLEGYIIKRLAVQKIIIKVTHVTIFWYFSYSLLCSLDTWV